MIRTVESSALTSGLRGYRDLLRVPAVARLVSWGLLARLPVGMLALALILLIRGHGGSYAEAGAVSAAQALAMAAGAPVAGRLIDRGRPAVVLIAYGAAFAAGCALLVGLTATGAPLAAVAAAAALAGATLPPISPTVRMLWPTLVDDDRRLAAAFAMEATLQELIFVSGPLLVGLCTALFSSSAGVLVAGVLSFVGVVGFVTSGPVRASRSQPHPRRHLLAALAPPAIRRIVILSAGYGLAFGAAEVALPAFAEDHGGRALASLALAAWSGGSLVGGVVIGGHRPANPAARLRLISALFALALFLPLLAGSLPQMAAIMFLVGLPIAPSFAITYGMVQEAALPGTQAEVFGWLSTSIVVGIAIGNGLGGRLITHGGPSESFAVAIAGASFAALVAARGVRSPRSVDR